MDETHVFTLTDADGRTHHYEVFAFDLDEGEPILYELASLGVEPLVGMAMTLLGQGEGLDMSVERAFAQIDWAATGRAMRTALRGGNLVHLRRALLKNTIRDSQQLADPAAVNAAYQRNYGEMFLAVWEVIRFNRFFTLSSTGDETTTPKTVMTASGSRADG